MAITQAFFKNLMESLQKAAPAMQGAQVGGLADQAQTMASSGLTSAAADKAASIIDPYRELAASSAGGGGAAQQLAAVREGKQAMVENAATQGMQPSQTLPQASNQIAPSQPVQQGSALGGPSQVSPQQEGASQVAPTQEKPSVFQNIVNNLTGRNLNTPEERENWQKWQSIGAMLNNVGGAIAGGDNTGVGRAANALRDTFAGNIMANNAEAREMSANEYMQNAANALSGSSTGSTSTSAPATSSSSFIDVTATTPSSRLGSTGNTSTSFPSIDELSNRLRRISGM